MAAAAEELEPPILTFKVYKTNDNYHRIGTPQGLKNVKDFFEEKLNLGEVANVTSGGGGWGKPRSVFVEFTRWDNDENAKEFKKNILKGEGETVSYPGTAGETVLKDDRWRVEQYIPVTRGRAGFRRGGKKNRRHRKGKHKNKRTRNTRRHKNKRTRNTRRHKNKRTRNTRRRRRHK